MFNKENQKWNPTQVFFLWICLWIYPEKEHKYDQKTQLRNVTKRETHIKKKCGLNLIHQHKTAIIKDRPIIFCAIQSHGEHEEQWSMHYNPQVKGKREQEIDILSLRKWKQSYMNEYCACVADSFLIPTHFLIRTTLHLEIKLFQDNNSHKWTTFSPIKPQCFTQKKKLPQVSYTQVTQRSCLIARSTCIYKDTHLIKVWSKPNKVFNSGLGTKLQHQKWNLDAHML